MSGRRLLPFATVLLLLVPGVRVDPARADALSVLADGVAVGGELLEGERAWLGRVEVPEGATQLGVLVSADRDVDLFLRRDRPAEPDFAETADASAFSPSRHEVIVLGGEKGPALKAGTWYVTIENPFPQTGPVGFELIAFVDRRGGERTILPGAEIPITLSGPRRTARLRTYLPARATRGTIELVPPPPGGLQFQMEGPNGFRRRGDSRQGRLVLESDEAPGGTYILTFAPPSRPSRPVPCVARMSMTFPDGGTLPIPPSPHLDVGTPLPFILGGRDGPDVRRLRIEVPKPIRGFVLEAANAYGRDVDIHVRRGIPPRHEDEDAQWLAMSTAPIERLVVAGTENLPAGTYHAEIVLLDPETPVEVIMTLRRLTTDEDLYTWGKKDLPALTPDAWVRGVVRVEESGITWYQVDVPAGTGSLHAQLLGATGPLELLLARPEDGAIDARAFTAQVDEYLGVEFRPALQKATSFRLGVLNRATWDKEVRYRLAVAFDRRPTLPDDLVWPPVYTGDDLTPAERTAAATVEITIGDCSGGSGVCLTPTGLVMSCRHCLQFTDGTGRLQRDKILVAFPQTLDVPPVQTFFAKIVEEDEDRDLVLLAPLKDVFGRPVGDAMRFPYVPIAKDPKVRVGEELYVAGYPQVGSDCIRTAVVLSHGIVAGLERQPSGPAWIKTDAWVAPGHSGGPVVDAGGRLVGLAAATLGTTESLGLCVPIERFPKGWVRRIRDEITKAEAPEGAATAQPATGGQD